MAGTRRRIPLAAAQVAAAYPAASALCGDITYSFYLEGGLLWRAPEDGRPEWWDIAAKLWKQVT